jgi:hypothetical protein
MTDSDMAFGMAVPHGSPYGTLHSPWARGGRARTMVAHFTQRVDRGGLR